MKKDREPGDLTEAALATALQRLRDQVAKTGQPIGLRPTVWYFPPDVLRKLAARASVDGATA